MSANVLPLPTTHETAGGILEALRRLHVEDALLDLVVIGVPRKGAPFLWHTVQGRRDLAWAAFVLQGYVARRMLDEDEPSESAGA